MAVLDNWFIQVHDFIYVKEEEGSDAEAECILRLLGLRAGDRVLDAPSAAGRIAVRLARAGCHVTAVDINHDYLKRARARFQAEGLKGEFCQADLRRLPLREGFDAVCNWWSSFGYFSDAENLRVLRGMVAALRPGGRLIIEQPNRHFVLRRLRPVMTESDWVLLTNWNARTQRLESVWIHEEDGREERYPMSIRWYTWAQFRSLFRKAGLTLEAAYGDHDGSDYTPSSRRLIVVGRKG
ncbi:MAG TPA: class I SAM-dependent methyltransferase [Armatimonadota bacterium]|jgi:SAM-dependent methyltransferase|nr:methyltransferase domain-containing protein [Armatimonadota bacterium]HOJ20655.1 class I SAM-dependent methyltransferase [Armatimonadota bacterium]HOM80185.1 class I SAM-dependent methyltransferase [Armatimonadota bacterium]HOQ29079.1 class I SAM-dependent methyltransferase [Armatimonadota bacterium]HPO71608.1 class I SAM-dependent methyltransferase [Armatimonadota bacterium]